MKQLTRALASNAALIFLAVFCTASTYCSAQARHYGQDRRLDDMLREFRIEEIEQMLPSMGAGPERDYFSGMIANRTNNTVASIRLLQSALPELRKSRPDRARLALDALADDYRKNFRYADAARSEEDLLLHIGRQVKPDAIQGLKDDEQILSILQNAPPETVSWTGDVELKTERNPLHSINVSLTVNGVKGSWLLDTGANLSVVSRSFAKRLGLQPLPGSAHGQGGLTGIEDAGQVALLPSVWIGGAVLHNVVVVIMGDSSLQLGPKGHRYQINGILGYPVFQLLGAIRFRSDGYFEAGPAVQRVITGAQMYMDELSPVIECMVDGQSLPFYIDTGAKRTILFASYYERFHGKARDWHKKRKQLWGAGGMQSKIVFIQPQVRIGIGQQIAVLRAVSIFAPGTAVEPGDIYGNLGQDLFAAFDSFTINFNSMRFALGDPIANGSDLHRTAEDAHVFH